MQCASNKVESNLRTHAQKVKKRGAEENLLGYDNVLLHRQYWNFRAACHLHFRVQPLLNVGNLTNNQRDNTS
jgi:hypothetical protein